MNLITISPPENVIKAFSVLEHDVNFKTIINWLIDCAINEAMKNVYEENITRKHVADGRVQCIQLLLRYFNEAKGGQQLQTKNNKT